MHFALLPRIAEIHVLQIARILLTPFLAEDEVDHRQKFVLPKVIDEVRPGVLIEIEAPSGMRAEPASSASDRARWWSGRSTVDPASTVRVRSASAHAGEWCSASGRKTTSSRSTPTAGSSASSASTLNGWKTRCFPFFVLLATERLTSSIVSIVSAWSHQVVIVGSPRAKEV